MWTSELAPTPLPTASQTLAGFFQHFSSWDQSGPQPLQSWIFLLEHHLPSHLHTTLPLLLFSPLEKLFFSLLAIVTIYLGLFHAYFPHFSSCVFCLPLCNQQYSIFTESVKKHFSPSLQCPIVWILKLSSEILERGILVNMIQKVGLNFGGIRVERPRDIWEEKNRV